MAISHTIIENTAVRKYDKRINRDVEFEKLYLDVPDVGRVYLHELSICFIAGQGTIVKLDEVKNYEDFIKNFYTVGKVYEVNKEDTDVKKDILIHLTGIKPSDVKFDLELHTDFVSNPNNDAKVTAGCARTFSLTGVEGKGTDSTYDKKDLFLGKLNGESSERLIEFDRIYYFDAKGKPVRISKQAIVKKNFEGFGQDDRPISFDLYYIADENAYNDEVKKLNTDPNHRFAYNGTKIDSIDLFNGYTTELVKYDTKESGVISTHSIEADGSDKVISTRRTLSHMVEKTPEAVTDPATNKVVDHVIRNKIFTPAQNGQFIAVRESGKDFMRRADVKDLYDLSGSAICAGAVSEFDLSSWYGKELYIKQEGRFIKIDPLTAENERYEAQKMLVAKSGTDDAMAEDSYLKLANGQFVREDAEHVQPKSYKANENISDSQADAFLVVINDRTKVVVDGDFFRKNNYAVGKNIKIDGRYLPISSIHKLERCASSSADVIQITSYRENNVHKCEVVNQIAGTGVMPINKEKEASEVLDEFQEHYKMGEYILDKVEVKVGDETKFIDIDNRVCNRYVLSDDFVTADTSEKSGRSARLDGDSIKIEKTKDGKIGFASGGVKYDVSKAIKRDYETWRSLALGSLGMFSTGGVVIGLVAFPVVIAAGVAMVTAVPMIPIGERIRGLFENAKRKKDSALAKINKAEENNTQKKADIEKELVDIYTQTINEIKNIDTRAKKEVGDYIAEETEKIKAGKGLSEEDKTAKIAELEAQKDQLILDRKKAIRSECLAKLNNACGLEQKELWTLAPASINGSEFVIKDGVGKVTTDNAYQCVQFQKYYNAKVESKNRLAEALSRIKKIVTKLDNGKKLKDHEIVTLDQLAVEFLGESADPNKRAYTSSEEVVERLKQLLESKEAELETIFAEFNSGKLNIAGDPDFDRLSDNFKTMQAFLEIKMDVDAYLKTRSEASIFKDQFAKLLGHLDYDVVSGCFKIDGRSFTIDELREAGADGQIKQRNAICKRLKLSKLVGEFSTDTHTEIVDTVFDYLRDLMVKDDSFSKYLQERKDTIKDFDVNEHLVGAVPVEPEVPTLAPDITPEANAGRDEEILIDPNLDANLPKMMEQLTLLAQAYGKIIEEKIKEISARGFTTVEALDQEYRLLIADKEAIEASLYKANSELTDEATAEDKQKTLNNLCDCYNQLKSISQVKTEIITIQNKDLEDQITLQNEEIGRLKGQLDTAIPPEKYAELQELLKKAQEGNVEAVRDLRTWKNLYENEHHEFIKLLNKQKGVSEEIPDELGFDEPEDKEKADERFIKRFTIRFNVLRERLDNIRGKKLGFTKTDLKSLKVTIATYLSFIEYLEKVEYGVIEYTIENKDEVDSVCEDVKKYINENLHIIDKLNNRWQLAIDNNGTKEIIEHPSDKKGFSMTKKEFDAICRQGANYAIYLNHLGQLKKGDDYIL